MGLYFVFQTILVNYLYFIRPFLLQKNQFSPHASISPVGVMMCSVKNLENNLTWATRSCPIEVKIKEL